MGNARQNIAEKIGELEDDKGNYPAKHRKKRTMEKKRSTGELWDGPGGLTHTRLEAPQGRGQRGRLRNEAQILLQFDENY